MYSRFKERREYRIVSCIKGNIKIITTVDIVGLCMGNLFFRCIH